MTNKQQREELVVTSLERIATSLEKIVEIIEKGMEDEQEEET
tara:strand:- start:497 stop:622 length:126 start_codon:yes stop_codon:yes gene_type:complete